MPGVRIGRELVRGRRQRGHRRACRREPWSPACPRAPCGGSADAPVKRRAAASRRARRHRGRSSPFLPGALAGASLYFRDLSRYFFPLRRFALERLRAGRAGVLEPLSARGRAHVAACGRLPAGPAQLARARERRLLAAARPARSARARSSSSPWRGASASATRRPGRGARVSRWAASPSRRSTSTSTCRLRRGRRSWRCRSSACCATALADEPSPPRRCAWRWRSPRPGSRSSRSPWRPGSCSGWTAAPRGLPGAARGGARARRRARGSRARPRGLAGVRQRPRTSLLARSGSVSLDPSLRPRSDPGRQPVREPGQPRERVVGSELLPARLSVRR